MVTRQPDPQQPSQAEKTTCQQQRARNWGGDDDKSSARTDEGEHEAWGKMSVEDIKKHFSVGKRKHVGFDNRARKASRHDGLQPDIQIPADILEFLDKHQLGHLSHPSEIKGGNIIIWIHRVGRL